MDGKVFNAIEIIFVGALLVAVLHFGGVFGETSNPAPALAQPTALPFHATAAAQFQLTFTAARDATTAAQNYTPTSTLRPTRTPVPTAAPDTYPIIAGDTCITIAIRFDISLESLTAANNLDSECHIFAGGTLKIPAPTPTIAP